METTIPVIIKNGLLNTNDVTFNSLFGKKAWSIPIKEYINVIMNGEHNANLYAFSIPYIGENEIKNKFNKTYQLALASTCF